MKTKPGRKQANKSALREIPGVGPNLAADLHDLGIENVSGLKRRSPENLYKKLCEIREARVDRCVLYVFRCAVYYAETAPERRDPEKLKWWNWKD